MFGSDNQGLTIVIKAIDNATSVLKKVDESVQSTTSNFSKAQDASKVFATTLAWVATAFSAVAYSGIKTAASLETSQKAFEGLFGSAEEARKVMSRIKKEAASTPFELQGLTEATKQLSSVTNTGDEAIDILLNVGRAITASGGGQEELSRVVYNLKQIKGMGELNAIDLKELRRAIPIFDKIVIAAGTTVEEIQNSVDPAKALFDVFEKGGQALPAVANAFSNQAGTFNQLWSNMKDSMNIFLADFVRSTGIFDAVKNAISSFVDFMNKHKDGIVSFFSAFTSSENIQGLKILGGMILGALVPAFYAIGGAIVAATIPLLPWIALGGAVILMLSNLNEIVKLFTQDGSLIWKGYKLMIIEVFEGIKKYLSETWGTIKSLFADAGNFLIGIAENWANSWVDAVNIIIKALNKISFSIPDWVPGIGGKSFGINIDLAEKINLPRFEQGGIVPGAVGQAVPIMAHGQERIIPASRSSKMDSGGSVFNITINNPIIRNQGDVNIMRQQIDQALRDLIRVHKLQTI